MVRAKHFPEWEKMTVREIRAYLEKRQSVILPIGVIEQHGYHLPTSTDAVIAAGISIRVGSRTGMLVAPPIHMSFSGGQLPGTINVSPNVMGLVVGDVLRSLVAQGFKNIFLVLGHGGSENLRALDNALKLLLRHDPTFESAMLVFAPLWKFSPQCQKAFADRDWHAGWLETSIVMELAPHLVQMENLATDRSDILALMREHPDNYQYARKPVDSEFVVPRMAQRPEIEVGVMGTPAKASPKIGGKIVRETVEKMSKLFLDLEEKRSKKYRKVAWTPEPIILA